MIRQVEEKPPPPKDRSLQSLRLNHNFDLPSTRRRITLKSLHRPEGGRSNRDPRLNKWFETRWLGDRCRKEATTDQVLPALAICGSPMMTDRDLTMVS